jgi:putative DNA primase/helicase
MSDAEDNQNGNVIPLQPIDPPDEIKAISHQTLMRDFVNDNKNAIRYVDKWHRWLLWNGSKWEMDEKLSINWRIMSFVYSVSKRIKAAKYNKLCEGISPIMPKTTQIALRRKFKLEARAGTKELEGFGTSMSVLGMVKAHEDVASATSDWDSNPWLLNTPKGTINLRTGTLQSASQFDYITKSTAVYPGHNEPKLWLSFLRKIMRDDESMVDYLQKVFGYCLVGDPMQHEMYFGYGTGRNGKGVMLRTISKILGDYAAVANIETFTVTSSDRHPTELADLRGARLVTCGETNEGQHWAEAKIKELTGGDPVKARFMRQDFFTYTPQFKLFLTGNHKPRLNNIDAAIEARFRLIPFAVTIPEAERDLELEDKLVAEWPDILGWAIQGCLKWQAEGLTAPNAVASATKSYMSQEDAITSWINECCDLTPSGFAYTADLFESWHEWCKKSNDSPGNKRRLSTILEERQPLYQIHSARRSKGNGFAGIELLTPSKSDE